MRSRASLALVTVSLLAPACGGGDDDGGGGGADAAPGDGDGGGDGDLDAALNEPAGWTLAPDDVGLAPHGLVCDDLPLYEGASPIPAGNTLSEVRIEGNIAIANGMVTIERSCIKGEVSGGNPIIIIDSELDGTDVAGSSRGYAEGPHIRISGSYVHDYDVGIWFDALGGPEKRVVIDGNVIHARGIAIESQALIGADYTSAEIVANHLVVDEADSEVVYLGSHAGDISEVAFRRNLLDGPNTHFEIYQAGGNPVTGTSAIDNRFAGAGENLVTATTWSVWTDNYVFDEGGEDGAGAPVAAP